MVFHIISAVPALLESPLSHSILQRARNKGLLDIKIYDLHDYGVGSQKQIDDYQFGGGAGMVMMVEPLYNCIQDIFSKYGKMKVMYVTPDGQTYKQQLANEWSMEESFIIICGHYKGIDQRVRDHLVDIEVSIGDFVLSGGELAALILVDSIARLIPGVLNDASSALTDSFQDNLLAPPVYTRPANFKEWKVPEVLLSGHDAKISAWRENKALESTQSRRPDLLND